MEFDELLVNVKFLVKLKNNLNEIIEILNTIYGENALKKTTISKWIKRFNEACESF